MGVAVATGRNSGPGSYIGSAGAGFSGIGGSAVALVDADGNGRYNEFLSLPFQGSVGCDMLAFDYNRNGQFDRSLDNMEDSPLSKMISAEGAYYSVTVPADGSTIALEKIDPPMASFEVIPSVTHVMLLGEAGYQTLKPSKDGKCPLAAGKYMALRYTVSKTDAKGKVWTTSAAQQYQPAAIELKPGETYRLKTGPPLAMKINTQNREPGTVEIEIAIIGQGGETYDPRFLTCDGAGVSRTSVAFKIVNEQGQVLQTATSEYG